MPANSPINIDDPILFVTILVDGSPLEDYFPVQSIDITHEINTQTNRDVKLNQVHASLQRLEEKGVIVSRMCDPTPERGGRRKRLFTITAYGQQTLRDIQSVRSQFWNSISSTVKSTSEI